MKYLLMMLLLIENVYANCCCVKPKPKKPVCKPIVKVVEKPVERVVEKKVEVFNTKTVVKTVRKMNMIKGLAGFGPIGVDINRSGNTITAEQKMGIVFGAEYSRRIAKDSDVFVGVQGLSNRSGLLSVGLEF
jgi:hypothetical protein